MRAVAEDGVVEFVSVIPRELAFNPILSDVLLLAQEVISATAPRVRFVNGGRVQGGRGRACKQAWRNKWEACTQL